jgi:HEPN domain-containing protein
MTMDSLLNDFAIRSFRDEGDADYISARMSFRAAIDTSLWASQQMVEKYLKCILLLNRIPARHVKHDLHKGIDAIHQSGKISLDLTPKTQQFINYIDSYGVYRYLGTC